jgi:hypothetical protein
MCAKMRGMGGKEMKKNENDFLICVNCWMGPIKSWKGEKCVDVRI